MMTKLIETNDELEDSKYYHCFDRNNMIHSIHKCSAQIDRKSVGSIWAMDDNNQALERWYIVPVEIPVMPFIGICGQHNGSGFQSDCILCKRERKIKEAGIT